MTKRQCIATLNQELRYALRSYHASSGLSQEDLADKMQITPRACSGLENGEYGFSVFSMMALFAILPAPERNSLFAKLCSMMIQMRREAA